MQSCTTFWRPAPLHPRPRLGLEERRRPGRGLAASLQASFPEAFSPAPSFRAPAAPAWGGLQTQKGPGQLPVQGLLAANGYGLRLGTQSGVPTGTNTSGLPFSALNLIVPVLLTRGSKGIGIGPSF